MARERTFVAVEVLAADLLLEFLAANMVAAPFSNDPGRRDCLRSKNEGMPGGAVCQTQVSGILVMSSC